MGGGVNKISETLCQVWRDRDGQNENRETRRGWNRTQNERGEVKLVGGKKGSGGEVELNVER